MCDEYIDKQAVTEGLNPNERFSAEKVSKFIIKS